MSIKFTLFAIYAVLLSTLTTAPTFTMAIAVSKQQQTQHAGEINDINTNVTLFDGKVLQLLLNWKDNLPKETSYNVIVSTLNQTKCPEPPCSLYGISKPKGHLIIPENPMIYVEEKECNYMPGCNYTLTVETSNAMVGKKTIITIPDCVMDLCSCQHADSLPKVLTVANIPSNDTIIFNWSIKLNDDANEKATQKTHNHDVLAANKLSKIYLEISAQANPSLSWGGKLIPIIENVYSLKNISYTATKSSLQGNFKIKLQKQLTPKAVLNLHSYIIDELHCSGPDSLIKAQVPAFYETETTLVQNSFDLRLALTIVCVVFLFAIIMSLVFCLWQRRKEESNAEMNRDGKYLSPFATVVEMEDNINYIDKYVEEAQAKGLADVFEVPHHSIRLGSEIGEGAFGRVYKAIAVNLRRMRGTTVVAVKQLKNNPSTEEIGEFLSEIEMLKGVGTHNNIVCFLGCCTIQSPYLMIMEFVGRGDLLTYLRTVRYESAKCKTKDANYVSCRPAAAAPPSSMPVKYIELKMSTQSVDSDAADDLRQPKTSFAETTYTIIDDEEYNEPFEYILDHKELHNFAMQIANGMRFLEEQEITHRDLAARNVLIDDRKTLKISDFGLSRHGVYTNTKTRKLPLRWLSLEAIRDNIYSSRSDVWAYGVVLWEIGTLGASPYPTISNHELIPYLLEGKRLEKPEICTEQMYAIMLQCWDENPDSRPTFEVLYNALNPKTTYVDINSLSDDYVFPPIKDKDNN